MQISDVMTPCPYKITFDIEIEEALRIMEMRNISHLPIVDGEEVIGVVSRKELEIAKVAYKAANLSPTVDDICDEAPYTVSSSTAVSVVTEAMADKRTDYALVTDTDGNFVGIFTVTDACRIVTRLLNQQP